MRAPAALVLATALAAGVAGCGGGSSHPSATTTAAKGPSQQAIGLHFRVQVPPRWTDVSSQLSDPDTRYDLAAGDTTAKGFKSTVLVLRDREDDLHGKTIQQLDAEGRARAAKDKSLTVTSAPPLKLDGTVAPLTLTTRTQGGMKLTDRRVVALHDDELYSIQLTTTANDPDADRILKTFVGSWRWTS